MLTAERYIQYIKDFNAVCAADGTLFDAFYDEYYEPDAVFESIPMVRKNTGKRVTVAFWREVHDAMQEEIKPHRSLVISGTKVATEAPIDFTCKRDLEWVGVQHKADSTFRLLMAAFYDVSPNDKFQYVRSEFTRSTTLTISPGDTTLISILYTKYRSMPAVDGGCPSQLPAGAWRAHRASRKISRQDQAREPALFWRLPLLTADNSVGGPTR